MRTDAEVLAEIDAAFASFPRPEHFTNFTHCEECAEHDELLCSRDRDSLKIEDVGNPGWDPICFCSSEGKAYFMPALARLSLEPPTHDYGWYGDQLVFHLWSGGEYNDFYHYCSPSQRSAIASLLRHYVESRAEMAELSADEIFQALERWQA